MSDIVLKTVSPEPSTQERVSLKSPEPKKQKEIKLDRVELSDNIRAFDKKPRVYTSNPYSRDQVLKGMKTQVSLTPTAEQAVLNPLYNRVGHILGVDMAREWNMSYDKVVEIVSLARNISKIEDDAKLAEWIFNRTRESSSMYGKRITDVLVNLKMNVNKETHSVVSEKPKVIYKTVYKYVKEKPKDVKSIAARWMNKILGGTNGS